MGVHQRGSHFPICVFTNNVGRRSPQKLEERRQKQMWRSWRGPQWWAQGSQEGCKARTQDADPQQGRQSRPRGGCREVAEVWPAVAGSDIPDRFARWKEGRRRENSPDIHARWKTMERRGADTSCSQASNDIWNPGWRQPWPSTEVEEWWAAVAAVGPIRDTTQWWPTAEPDPLDNETPAGALRRTTRGYRRAGDSVDSYSVEGEMSCVRVHL